MNINIIPAWTPNIFFDQQGALAGHPGGTSGLTLFDKNQLLGRTEIRFKRTSGHQAGTSGHQTGTRATKARSGNRH